MDLPNLLEFLLMGLFPFGFWQIEAHRSPLAAMVLSSNGMYLATASEQGTLVRVYLVSEATKVNSNMHNILVGIE